MLKRMIIVLGAALLFACQPQDVQQNTSQSEPQPLKVKAVVVTMFEIGEDEGDKPGEFQLWKERQQLTKRYPFPQSHHDIFANKDTGVIGIVTGMGTAKATAAIMALGLDPRFDLTQAYWLVAGIAGIDPADGTIGSAVWADYLIDGDLAHQIDAREIPEQWSTGYFPLFANAPYPADVNSSKTHHKPAGEVYKLNASLSQWAFNLTKGIVLQDTDAMVELRNQYSEHPAAMAAPKVMQGDHLAASTFWHGKLLNQWANDWTAFWTDGEGNFVTSGMEDTGSYQAMQYLDAAGKADKTRFMVLRTASNFTMQPPGLTAAENLEMESSQAGYAGMQPALEAAYVVGSAVVDELVNKWSKYQTQPPQSDK
ncbi:purine nucleoside permease [Alteromonas pelagimontana]|uniref:Purine nucleoside permease n=1 Tax=Alteromonas pelagimontana TaxID=1858656 RepID=A0A6M4M991_9ALTE|nr:purine nucleoside permease [Alteromonas pelagimontana]QJR79539.1 purine nucleoside permease [Alteromonas pelagimontana]